MNYLSKLALLCATYVAAASATQFLNINGLNNGPAFANADSRFQTSQEIFVQDSFLTAEALKNSNGEFLDSINANAAYVLLVYLTSGMVDPRKGGGVIDATNWFNQLDPKRASEWGRALGRHHVAYIARDEVNGCGIILANMFQYINPSVLGSVSVGCMTEIMRSTSFNHSSDNKWGFNLSHLFKLNDDILKRYAHQIITGIVAKTGTDSTFFGYLPEKAFSIFNARPEGCTLITGAMLVTYYDANNRFPKLAADCTKYINISTMQDNIESLDDRFFEGKIGSQLHDEAWKQLTPSQIKYFGAALGAARCAKFRFELIEEGRVRDIILDCWYGIYNRMLNYDGGAFPSIGSRWNDVNWDLLKKLSLTSQFKKIYDLISADDWEQINDTTVNKFLDTIYGCKDIPAAALIHSGLKIKSTCFSLLSPESQIAVLKNANNLPDDIFHFLKTKDVEQWSAFEEYAGGLGMIQLIAHHSNIGTIIKGLRQYDGPHPCSTIRDVETLVKTPILSAHMNSICFQSMKIDQITQEQFDELPKRIWALQSYDKILKIVENWNEVAAETITDLASGGHFCQAVSQEIVSKLSKEGLRAINSECFVELTAKANYPAELIQGMSPTIGRKLTAENYDELKIQDMSDAQYSQLSEDVEDESKHIATKLSSSDVSAMSAGRVGVLPVKFVTAMPAEAMKGIDSAEKMKAFKPSSLVKVTLEQAKNMTALEHITESQVRQLGIDIKDANSGLYALQPILEKLSPEARAAAEERLGKNSATISTVNVLLLAALASIAFLLPQF